jgi:hypothetical protein
MSMVFEREQSAETQNLLTAAQTAIENPKLEFRDGQFLFSMTNIEGGQIERFVSNAAVREAFSGIPIDSGWLRPEVARWGDGTHGEWAVAFIPPGVHELEITNEANEANPLERLHVPLPGLVWLGIGTQYYVWAVKTAKLEPYHEIYRAPLPNVYLDGKICWGLVRPPRATARTLFDAWELFIKSTFNNHLASGKSYTERDDVRIWLRANAVESIQSAYTFHCEDLLRQVEGVGVTLDKALRVFFETGEIPQS